MARHLGLGELGEELAARHLEEKGLRVVARRVRFARGELDIVAREGRAWVFVEVRLKSGVRFGRAAESFTPSKKTRFRRAVEEYVYRNGLSEAEIRCDFVAIDMDGEDFVISHYPGGIVF